MVYPPPPNAEYVEYVVYCNHQTVPVIMTATVDCVTVFLVPTDDHKLVWNCHNDSCDAIL